MTSLAPRPRPRACGGGRVISHAWLILLFLVWIGLFTLLMGTSHLKLSVGKTRLSSEMALNIGWRRLPLMSSISHSLLFLYSKVCAGCQCAKELFLSWSQICASISIYNTSCILPQVTMDRESHWARTFTVSDPTVLNTPPVVLQDRWYCWMLIISSCFSAFSVYLVTLSCTENGLII